MNQDLKIIKKKYGEKMMHLCRDMFPTILETEGALSQILLDKFEPCRYLYEDIIKNNKVEDFKSYIYKVFASSYREEIKKEKSPFELLDEAGYILYECKTEEDIQSFKKYYKKDEELCTFNGGRLDNCYVYFAVKKNVNEIIRESFKNPERQDLYGTSVISIQFTKDSSHILSIKNRYNHTVENPDATFGNNLDNIILGLTNSFEIYCGMKQQFKSEDFEIKGYVMANDGKYYKYNMEIYNVYYCPNNIIIDNFEVKKYPKEKYIVLDYFILDLKSGDVKSYDYGIDDSFKETMKDCGKPVVYNEGDYKKIIFYIEKKSPIIIVLDKLNNIVEFENKNIKRIHARFLRYNKKLLKINIPNVNLIEHDFLYKNQGLTQIDLPKVKRISSCFLENNNILNKISLPNVEYIGGKFLRLNKELTEIDLPKAKKIDYSFLSTNKKIKKVSIPNVEYIYGNFLCCAVELKKLDMPKVKEIGDDFLYKNKNLKRISLPNVEIIGSGFLLSNSELIEIDLPKAIKIHNFFLCANEKLQRISMPNVEIICSDFLLQNRELIEIELSSVKEIGESFLYHNEKLEKIDLPNVEIIQSRFLSNNEVLNEINIPKVSSIYYDFLKKNTKLRKITILNMEIIEDIIKNNPNLEIIISKDKQYKKQRR